MRAAALVVMATLRQHENALSIFAILVVLAIGAFFAWKIGLFGGFGDTPGTHVLPR